VQGNPAQFTLAAAPLDDDPEGKTSRFELDDAVLADLLSGEDDVTGRLNVTIDGTDQVGEIDHHAHDHAHDHGDHEGHDHAEGDHEGHDHAEGEHDHAEGEHDHDHADGEHDDNDHADE